MGWARVKLGSIAKDDTVRVRGRVGVVIWLYARSKGSTYMDVRWKRGGVTKVSGPDTTKITVKE